MSTRCTLPETLRWRVMVSIVNLPPLPDRTILREFCDAGETDTNVAATALQLYDKRRAALCEASWEGKGRATVSLQSSPDGLTWAEVKAISYPFVNPEKLLAMIDERM